VFHAVDHDPAGTTAVLQVLPKQALEFWGDGRGGVQGQGRAHETSWLEQQYQGIAMIINRLSKRNGVANGLV